MLALSAAVILHLLSYARPPCVLHDARTKFALPRLGPSLMALSEEEKRKAYQEQVARAEAMKEEASRLNKADKAAWRAKGGLFQAPPSAVRIHAGLRPVEAAAATAPSLDALEPPRLHCSAVASKGLRLPLLLLRTASALQ